MARRNWIIAKLHGVATAVYVYHCIFMQLNVWKQLLWMRMVFAVTLQTTSIIADESARVLRNRLNSLLIRYKKCCVTQRIQLNKKGAWANDANRIKTLDRKKCVFVGKKNVFYHILNVSNNTQFTSKTCAEHSQKKKKTKMPWRIRSQSWKSYFKEQTTKVKRCIKYWPCHNSKSDWFHGWNAACWSLETKSTSIL